MRGITRYSETIFGAIGNHGLPVRFDKTDGYLGISQEGERVLLSPAQVKELLIFLGAEKSPRRTSRASESL